MLLLLAATLFMGGCEDAECLGIWTEVEPDHADLLVGDELTARVFQESCSGSRVEIEAHWTSTDTLVARVDSLTGHVTAVGAGNADILAIGPPSAWLGTLPVVVTTP